MEITICDACGEETNEGATVKIRYGKERIEGIYDLHIHCINELEIEKKIKKMRKEKRREEKEKQKRRMGRIKRKWRK